MNQKEIAEFAVMKEKVSNIESTMNSIECKLDDVLVHKLDRSEFEKYKSGAGIWIRTVIPWAATALIFIITYVK